MARGARHITFGDPDFLQRDRPRDAGCRGGGGTLPRHHLRTSTIKVEHLIAQAKRLPRLRETGCLFVTSAVESFDDAVLARLRKGHTRRDVERAVRLCRDAGLTLAPTFIAFTPWTTLETYRDLLAEIDRLDLVDQVAPIQLTLRLLVTAGSALLELDDSAPTGWSVRRGEARLSVAARGPGGGPPCGRCRGHRGPKDDGGSAGRLRGSPHACVCGMRSATPSVRAGAPAGRDALPERTVVLLSGAHGRAGCSGLTLR